MWLHEVQIRNFRKIDALTVSFSRGLTVLVGENNSGKTTVIDALRLMLFSSRDGLVPVKWRVPSVKV